MRTSSATWIAFAAAAVLGFGVACVVDFPPGTKFACTQDSDCGGGGWICTPAAAGPRYCCKPSGAEVCDGKDNDCNGVTDDIAPGPCYSGPAGTENVGLCRGGTAGCADGGSICLGEVLPRAEICNNADDNCDGVKDEGFDLKTDPQNCGACGRGCSPPLRCEDGGCSVPIETNCSDGIDNDGDRAIDCADSDCVGQSCGFGCVCRNLGKVETECGDGQDNDSDTFTDCADSDCDGGSCGTGCVCRGGLETETLCSDGLDNDSDGRFDCADVPDCNGLSCGSGCTCAGGVKTETSCGDSADNDSDTFIDCADSDCDGGSCGTGCTCAQGQKTETNCTDRQDNDGDGTMDRCDLDCSTTGCGAGCSCDAGTPGIPTEVNCLNGSGDEDGDGLFNCNDPDCLGKTCRTNPSVRTCVSLGNCQ